MRAGARPPWSSAGVASRRGTAGGPGSPSRRSWRSVVRSRIFTGSSATVARRWPSRSPAPSSANGSSRRTFRWRDLDLAEAAPAALRNVPFVAGNDATLAGLAEARRGVAAGVPVVLYLSVEVGIGGVLLVGGRPLLGALGEAGSSGTCPSAIPRCAARAARADAGTSRSTAVRLLARSAGVHLPTHAASPSGRSRRPDRAHRTSLLPSTRSRTRSGAARRRRDTLDPSLVAVGALAVDLLDIARRRFERATRRG